MKQKVFAIGESPLDIIFYGNQVKAAKPGGAMLNSSVSLGKTGIDISLITEIGEDQTGNIILDFLQNNGVNTRNVHVYKEGKTPLAMAFLDKKGDAAYDFYKPYPKKRLQIEMPEFSSDDILLFGSYFGIDPRIREKIMEIVKAAKDVGSLIVYDHNFRKAHAHELEKLKPFILENMQQANIIRASDEDINIIFNINSLHGFKEHLQATEKFLIMTRSSEKVEILTDAFYEEYPVKKINVVSTIGAGDNFNAGLIYGLVKNKVTRLNIQEVTAKDWGNIIFYGQEFSANICKSFDNYISDEFAASVKK
ncbi:MAG: PfkB family carbohydrate kinase [Bacteroidales bacterium]